ncbi:MAG: RluA family pseudouridine synthase [Caulobacteraceae bacterium]
MAEPEDDDALDLEPDLRVVEIFPDEAGERLDKVLAARLADLSRARLQALIGEGRVTFGGAPVGGASEKAKAGLYHLEIPAPLPADPLPENLPLAVLFEDEHLIVIDKPPGMAAHPAPGTPSGTLVNALLAHCGASLSGIGGVARPGIVHRLDKDTSGVMVAAKTDAAHQGLSALFAAHDIERLYIALARGAPKAAKGTVATRLGRSSADRKKMAVLKSGGREAVTHYQVKRAFGPAARPPKNAPLASRIECRLETGRTHQIRVHLAHVGAPVLADPLYGSGSPAAPVKAAMAAAGLQRQALHAAVLGFVHPVTGETLRFETPLPEDMAQLEAFLSEL